MATSANWNYPTNVKLGAGRISELPDFCKDLGMTSVMLVTDPGLAGMDMVTKTKSLCDNAGLPCSIFSGIKPNPTGANIEDGITALNKGQHDGVIAFGGGSALDAAKAIALVARQKHTLWDFEDIGDNWLRADVNKIVPVVAVPTTAGTGSEVGRASVISNQEEKRKVIIFHPGMLPEIVILDPELTTGLPAQLTAATGMDALSHNLEAYCSPFYHPMAEGIAIEGIRLVKRYLPTAVKDGNNIEARTQMLVASTMGATAFQRGLGAMHALAHPMGALYDAHHGMLNAILMPYVLVANREVIKNRIKRLSQYLGLDNGFDGFLEWVLDLRAEIGIPHNLAAIGIDDKQLELIGKMAVEDPTAGTNPITFDSNQYQSIARKALNGQLG